MTDQEQAEVIKKWWRDYGKALTVAITIGVIAGFGWRYWQQKNLRFKEQSSIVYQSMMIADIEKQPKVAKQYADQLIQKYNNTPYASMAGLLLARDAVQQNKLSVAFEKLKQVIDKGRIASLRQIARIRAARVLLAQKKLSEALTILGIVDDETFEPLIENVRGDIFQAQGKGTAARKAYEIAKVGLESVGINNPILVMKLAQPLGENDVDQDNIDHVNAVKSKK